ncbi:MAG: Sua5/YciO/YrdC/YwlC family protein, partial [Deltaproteobacteria bacterium]|nr:Sua5/YciO/YrdC/YwlC family protein [Deltaproteobacteria bacterium]
MPVSGKKSLKIDPEAPDSKIIASGASAISKGGVVLFPTQGLYGLAANALDEKAVNRIFTIKQRPPEKPLL